MSQIKTQDGAQGEPQVRSSAWLDAIHWNVVAALSFWYHWISALYQAGIGTNNDHNMTLVAISLVWWRIEKRKASNVEDSHAGLKASD
jgi:hypothetical protein